MSQHSHAFRFLAFFAALAFMPIATPVLAQEEIWDPIEPVNRGVFWANDKLDIYLLEPAAKVYDHVVPDVVQDGVNNFFDNLDYPGQALSDLVQFKFCDLGVHTSRFVVNSTIGVAGLIDVASRMGLEKRRADFGLALAYRKLPPGPYLVVPLYGPTNLRDGVGQVVDALVHPFAILYYSGVRAGIADKVTWGGAGLDLLQTRTNMLDAIQAAKESSVDYYLFVQSAYVQHRDALLRGESTSRDWAEETGGAEGPGEDFD